MVNSEICSLVCPKTQFEEHIQCMCGPIVISVFSRRQDSSKIHLDGTQVEWAEGGMQVAMATNYLVHSCIHDSFLKLCPPGKYYKEATLTVDQVSSLPALRVNPFRDRICRVFSHNNVFSFEDVLGMASVFSEQACPSLKIEYAFRIYADFNENGFIDEEDLQRIILRLLNSDDMSEDLLTDLTSHVLNESDLDNDNMLSFSEFEHAMAKSPDFMK
ncbi:hypothetical protein MJT46_003263 [Ovis ammon polii x Ovis aries]|nr:hypothetical protein MJT46_003263 [Ovis ammon polii x Ovis aries]